MSIAIKGGDKNEIVLSDDIQTITAEINAYQRIAGEAIFEIGRRLKHVRDVMEYGEYIPWLDSINMDRRRASEFIRVFVTFNKENVQTFGHFGMTALLLITDLPESERTAEHVTAKGETKTPDEMTVRELRELKRQLKEAQEEREQSKQQAELERNKRERLEKENEEIQQELNDRLEDIPGSKKQRQAIDLVYFDNLTQEQAAGVMGVTRQAVDLYARNAINKMKSTFI